MRALLCCLGVALSAQATLSAQAPPAPPPAREPGAAPGTAAAPALPDLGPPAALPDGAPRHLEKIDRQGLRAHAYWLADDARAGRFTGSKAQQETAKYIADHFQKLGLKPLGDKKTFLQSYELEATALDASTALAIGSARITDCAVLPASATDKVALNGKLLLCGQGRADDIPANLKGRIPVVVFTKQPRGQGTAGDLGAVQRFGDLARQLAKAEATAGVVVLPGDAGALGNTLNYAAILPDHPRLSFGGQARGQFLPIPLFVVGGAPAQQVLDQIGVRVESDGSLSGTIADTVAGKLTIALKAIPKAAATNVVAVLEGRSKKAEAVVFSAHHDHIGRRVDGDAFNGADDNASGSAGLLEIAEAFAKGGERPARSIVFLSVSGEELGLWGSKHFAEHPTWPLDKIVADINIDMIGRAGSDGDKTAIQITPSKSHEKYSSIARQAVQLGQLLGVTFSSGDQYYQRSDHYNFAVKGVPVVFLCDGEHPDYHQVTDSGDKLDYSKMETIARLAFWTGWQVAESKDRPKELGAQADW